MMQKTPNEKIHTRTTATMEVYCPPRKKPKRQKKVARRSTIKMAPDNCHDGIDDQKGPLARVMKISQFSVKEISKNNTASVTPKFWMIPAPGWASMVVRVIQVPMARTIPRRTDIPHSFGRFHLTGDLEKGALS